MIILFKHCADIENCENFRDFSFVYTSVKPTQCVRLFYLLEDNEIH